MLTGNFLKVTLAATIFCLIGTGKAPAKLFGKKNSEVSDISVPYDAVPGGIEDYHGVRKYGVDPHFICNPNPWSAPAMYSGFRHYHYHLPAPVEPPGMSSSEDVFPRPEEQDPRTAIISVKVPETAAVWIFGSKTQQSGSLRYFVTPPLENGQNTECEIKASWMDGQKQVEQIRRVNLYPGARLTVDFLNSDAEIGPIPRRMP